MKHDWEWRSFEACLEKVIYTKKLQSSDYLTEGKYPIVSQEEDLISGYWDNDDDIFKITKPIVIFGDHTRVLKYIDFNFVLGADGVKILQPIDDIRAKFLYYYLKWFNVPSLGYSRHYKLLKECSIPVPPLPIQQQIVDELDKLSEIIEKKKQQVKELDTLAQSIFYDMFGDPVENEKGWEVKKMKDCCSKIGSGATPKGGDSSYKNEGISLIRSLNIHNQGFKWENLAYIDDEQAAKLSNVELQYSDVLLNITGASVARCCVVPDDVLPARVNQHVSILRCNNDLILPLFLKMQLTNTSYQDELISLSRANGATREALPKNVVEKLRLILPPLSLQQSFAQKIEAIEKQKELINQSIKEAQTLFDARMDYYFGE